MRRAFQRNKKLYFLNYVFTPQIISQRSLFHNNKSKNDLGVKGIGVEREGHNLFNVEHTKKKSNFEHEMILQDLEDIMMMEIALPAASSSDSPMSITEVTQLNTVQKNSVEQKTERENQEKLIEDNNESTINSDRNNIEDDVIPTDIDDLFAAHLMNIIPDSEREKKLTAHQTNDYEKTLDDPEFGDEYYMHQMLGMHPTSSLQQKEPLINNTHKQSIIEKDHSESYDEASLALPLLDLETSALNEEVEYELNDLVTDEETLAYLEAAEAALSQESELYSEFLYNQSAQASSHNFSIQNEDFDYDNQGPLLVHKKHLQNDFLRLERNETETPLLIPDRNGIVEDLEENLNADQLGMRDRNSEKEVVLKNDKEVRSTKKVSMANHRSYLAQQDQLYLSLPPPEEVRFNLFQEKNAEHTSAINFDKKQCILVVFSHNDLRVHDNYCLSLAIAESIKAYREESSTDVLGGKLKPLPIVAATVLDYRCFAQPSVVGGFYRQSPQRAQFLLDNVACLRQKLEQEYNIPLIVRCGRPEEHIPRLAVELLAQSVYMTTQYSPHERRVQAEVEAQLKRGAWIHRRPFQLSLDEGDNKSSEKVKEKTVDERVQTPDDDRMNLNDLGFEVNDLIEVVDHQMPLEHPYRMSTFSLDDGDTPSFVSPSVHSVWQTTLVHLDDLPTPVSAMKEGERWYHDDVTVATIRPTAPYDKYVDLLKVENFGKYLNDEGVQTRMMSPEMRSIATKLKKLQKREVERLQLLPSHFELQGVKPPSLLRGKLPTLDELGYNDRTEYFQVSEVVATQSSHPPGEDVAIQRVREWLTGGGMTSMLRFGVLSPRKFYELVREFTQSNLRDGFVQMQYRECLLRLSRRDYWHWMGLRYGDRLFFSYGPHPENTDHIPNWRHDAKIVQRWCQGLTGIPFADAAMRELTTTGFVADVGRQGLVWLLTRGYSQDWRLAAEWLERNSLDYDPFICYGNTAYYAELMKDDFGQPVRTIHYLAHHHDQTGIYIKRWLPQLSKIHPVYIHRPHVLTPRMQAMHGVVLGRNYPLPIKLWEGAQHQLTREQLRAYFPQPVEEWKGPGYAEALRHGNAVLPPEELHTSTSVNYLKRQSGWARFLSASAFDSVADLEAMEEAEALKIASKESSKITPTIAKRADLI